MKTTAILIAALAGLSLTAPAHAQAPGQGAYLGIGYGSVWSKGGSFPEPILGAFVIGIVTEDTVPGGKVFAGYMMDDNWGMEIGLHHLGKYEVFEIGTGVKSDEFKTSAISVAGVYSTPIGAGYSFNGRLGLAFTNVEYDCLQDCGVAPFFLADAKKRGTSGMIGIGLGARLAQSLSFRIDFDHFGSVHHAVGTTVGNVEYKDSYDILSVNLVLLF